jgi:hypothetical protein
MGVGSDRTPLDERVRTARRRRHDSPEYLWVHIRERYKSRTVDPAGGWGVSDPELDPRVRDEIRDIPGRLNARINILSANGFCPSSYLGLSNAAKASGEQGWLAWEILPYLTWLTEYATASKNRVVAALEQALCDARVSAEGFLRLRLASRPQLTAEDRAVIDCRIGELFRPLGPPEYDASGVRKVGARYDNPYSMKFIEAHDRDREIINDRLELPTAWEPLPLAPNLAQQIVTQMKAKGHRPSQILSELLTAGLIMTPEAQQVRGENLLWMQGEVDRRFNSNEDDIGARAHDPGAKNGPDVVVISPGAAPTPRQIRMGRVRTAYLENHGDVTAAMRALKNDGHPVGQSTFYEYIAALDEQEPGWRDGVLSGQTGIPDGTNITRSRRKTRANGS